MTISGIRFSTCDLPTIYFTCVRASRHRVKAGTFSPGRPGPVKRVTVGRAYFFAYDSKEKRTIATRTEALATESHLRSLIKALSWRVTALIITVAVVKVVTGDTGVAAAVGGADALVKIGLYYFHERIWNRIRLGRGRRIVGTPQPKGTLINPN